MKISTKYGFAFLCMPKCSSTSIEAAIDENCNIKFSGHHPSIKHINAKVFSEFILPLHKELIPTAKIESFCLIRDPLEWIESWYRYRSREELKNPRHPNHKRYTGNMSYNDFIKKYLYDESTKSISSRKTQYNFLSLNSNEIGVDCIIPMDRLDLVSKFLFEKTGKEIKIPIKNVSNKLQTDLHPDNEEKLRQYFSKDIAIYEFAKKHGGFNKSVHSEFFFDTL